MTKISVEYDIQGRTFNYSGTLISKDENFLKIDDRKEGIISLNLKNVIKIKEVGE